MIVHYQNEPTYVPSPNLTVFDEQKHRHLHHVHVLQELYMALVLIAVHAHKHHCTTESATCFDSLITVG
jgi:hypothetical protein